MAESSTPVCVWLKRDLRVGDHPALAEAVARSQGGCVFAVFVYEPEVLAQPERDASHAAFERECLVELEAALARLGIRRHLQPAVGAGELLAAEPVSGVRRDLDADGLAGERSPPPAGAGEPPRDHEPARPRRAQGLAAEPEGGAVPAPLALPLHAEARGRAGDRVSQHAAGGRRPAGDGGLSRTARRGRTGYPLVDACLRSVVATGWLTFRMRALVVSFASYSLWLHWRPTGLFLARHFLDFEPGIHWSQLQMQSGTTGINTLRIYNPTKQAIEQDPGGVFIRRWVPELAGVPKAYVHMPWTMPAEVQRQAGCTIGRDYPAPLVDHAAAVREAKRRLAIVRDAPEARREARGAAARHGSRRDRRGAMQQDAVRRTLGRVLPPSQPSPAADPQRLLPFATPESGADPSAPSQEAT